MPCIQESDICLLNSLRFVARVATVSSLLLIVDAASRHALLGYSSRLSLWLAAFVLAGVGLLLVTRPGGGLLRWGQALGLAAAVFSIAELWRVASGKPITAHDPVVYLGPLGLLFAGPAVALVGASHKHKINAGQILGLLAAAIAMLGICELVLNPASSSVHLSRAAALAPMLLSLAILLARPDAGLTAVIAADSYAGAMARRLIPASALLIIGFAWLRFRGQEADYYSAPTGAALFVVATVFALVGIVWWTARTLGRADYKQRVVDEVTRLHADTLRIENAGLKRELEEIRKQVHCEASRRAQ